MNQLTRRHFIQTSGTASLALCLGISNKGIAKNTTGNTVAKNFNPLILVESNGNITIYNTKPEMGQGTNQSVPAMIAEEFEVSLDQVTIKQTNGEKEFGLGQRAGGSSSIRTGYIQFRKVGAAAKAVFILAASARWQVDPSICYAENGTVVNSTSKKVLTYGELVEDASKLELPKEPKLKDNKDFKIIGKVSKRPDIPLKTNGTAVFGLDVQLPDMVYATVERCPVLGGTLKTFDATEALKVPGVQKVVEVERIVGKYHFKGVAVIANSYWTALQGRKKLKIEWDTKGFETFNTAEFEDKLRKLANEEGVLDKNIGAIETVNIAPSNYIEAFYETPMIAHHTLEVMNCVAQVKGENAEIWTSTQVPSSVVGAGATDAPKLAGFKPDNVKFHSQFIGGGFGRRLYLDYIIEALNVAKHTDKPVKVIWTREDTTKQGPFRPMTFSQLSGGFSDDGKLLAFRHKVISPSYFESFSDSFDKTKVDTIMVEGIAEQAYEIPNIKTNFVRADYHVPVAAFRSVTSSTLAFAHECFIDELANKAGKDPFDFRMSLLTKPSDTKRVLQKLREVSNWDTPLAKGKGRGVAQWSFFAGLCAHVVEITYNENSKTIKIDKVTAVIDLGEVVNPDNVKNQVEGAIIMALTAAIKQGITLKNGVVEQNNFYDNELVRINETPQIEVFILAEGGKVKGVGEPGFPPFAPALANAIFAATGKRIRKMPFELEV